MSIALLAGSLEPGRDGVGDYTRLLASESERFGVECHLVALADRFVHTPTHAVEGGRRLLRLPARLPWRQRIAAAAPHLASLAPDWVSLQFVPFSFHRRGFASALARALPELTGRARLHVMFHEIWIDGSLSLRNRMTSAVQRRSVLRVAGHPGAVVQTSNPVYRTVLERHGISCGLLPLFGSIPVDGGAEASDWLRGRFAEDGWRPFDDRERWWVFVMFGALHPVWPPQPLLDELLAAARTAARQVAIVSVGRLGAGEALWRRMTETHGARMTLLRLGEQPPARIADVLKMADFGIATSPLPLIGKSATAAAMFDHGLPVIVNREDSAWETTVRLDERQSALVIRHGPRLAEELAAARRLPPHWSLPDVAGRWLEALGLPRTATAAW